MIQKLDRQKQGMSGINKKRIRKNEKKQDRTKEQPVTAEIPEHEGSQHGKDPDKKMDELHNTLADIRGDIRALKQELC